MEENKKEVKNINWEEIDESVAENFIKSMSFIFNETKKKNPISYAVFYSMQYIFWEIVVIGGDLLYALHDATMFVDAQNNDNNTWNFDIEINDTYDFTEFKELKEYVDKKNSILTDIVSTLLNNFGVVSSEYGVIKTYNVKIKFNINDYVIE